MSKYELPDHVVVNAKQLIVKSPITFEQAPIVQEIIIALSNPVKEEDKKEDIKK